MVSWIFTYLSHTPFANTVNISTVSNQSLIQLIRLLPPLTHRYVSRDPLLNNQEAFHSKLKSHFFKNSYPNPSDSPPSKLSSPIYQLFCLFYLVSTRQSL